MPNAGSSALVHLVIISASAGINLTVYVLGYDDNENAFLLGSGNVSALGNALVGPASLNARSIAVQIVNGSGTVTVAGQLSITMA